MTEKAEAHTKTGMGNSLVLIVLLLLLAVAFAITYTGYRKAQHKIASLTDPKVQNELNKEQTATLVAKLGKLAVLPAHGEPVVATIKDVELLASSQDFYKDAKNGESLVVYSAARKAYIYDDANNVLVNVGPVIIKNADGTQAPYPRVDGKLLVDIRNGSKTSGKAISLRDRLRSDNTLNLVHLGKAANADYTDAVLVDLTKGAKADLIKSLETTLGVKAVTDLPAGERATDAEVVIILGNK